MVHGRCEKLTDQLLLQLPAACHGTLWLHHRLCEAALACVLLQRGAGQDPCLRPAFDLPLLTGSYRRGRKLLQVAVTQHALSPEQDDSD